MIHRKKGQKYRKPSPIPKPDGLDSWEEQHTVWWLDELKEAGYILKYKYQPHTFDLSPVTKYKMLVKLKTKFKTTEHALIQPHVYTPDFAIYWSGKAAGLLYKVFGIDVIYEHRDAIFWAHLTKNGDPYTVIDTKPSFDQNNMTRLFIINAKWVYTKYKVYCQCFIPNKIFEKTFTPKRYLWNDAGNSLRCKRIEGKSVPISSLKKTVTLEEFILPTK